MKLAFWLSLFLIFYTFLGYGIVLFLLIKVRRLFKGSPQPPRADFESLPECTLVIAAYNEEDFIREKIANSLALHYPPGKLHLLFVTDGSTDKTPDIISEFPQITLLHQPQRNGKIAAMHRAAAYIHTEIIVFTDANTFLNPEALVYICRHYSDPKTGAVAGEKRIQSPDTADASAAGEGFYWKYESALKKWDAELYSVVGTAGELFSVRRNLYQPVEPDTILDDFMISMRIAQQGYRVAYEPLACATETASENIPEELKRKIRIAAGGIQSIIRLKALLNIFKYGTLSFQYISHRVLRWTITPFLLLLVFVLNILLVSRSADFLYIFLLGGQVLFYMLALIGMMCEKRHLRIKALFIPYYFCIMNYAVLAGMIRYFKKQQSASWEKSRRKKE